MLHEIRIRSLVESRSAKGAAREDADEEGGEGSERGAKEGQEGVN